MAEETASTKTIHAEVDLDGMMDEFSVWKYRMERLETSIAVFKEKLQATNNSLTTAVENEKSLKSELQLSRNMVSSLQHTITKQCNRDDENLELKEKSTQLEKAVEDAEKLHLQEANNLRNKIQDLESKHMTEMKEMKERLTASAVEQEAKLKSELGEKDKTIKDLINQVKIIKKEKAGELLQLKMECDSKISKLQSQLAKTQQSNSVSSNQDIFRKKLQHYKDEAERQISDLQNTVQELHDQLEASYQRQPVAVPSARNSYHDNSFDNAQWPQSVQQPGFNKKVMTSQRPPEQKGRTGSLSLSNQRGQVRASVAQRGGRGGKRGASPRNSANPLTFTSNAPPASKRGKIY